MIGQSSATPGLRIAGAPDLPADGSLVLFEHAELAREMIAAGYIKATPHPNGRWTVLNYARAAQFDRVWNPATLACRGLVIDEDWHVIARPLPKFFNLSEVRHTLPWDSPWTVWDKLDGSLLVVSSAAGELLVTTRGSAASEQAAEGAKILAETLGVASIEDLPVDDVGSVGPFTAGWTFCFEVRYPENRIVVDYGPIRDCVLLVVRNTQDGREVLPDDVRLDGFPFGRAERMEDLEGDRSGLAGLQGDGLRREGVIVRFHDGERVKVKIEDYVRLHRVVTNTSTVTIWEHLRAGQSFDDLLEAVPDEFDAFVRTTRDRLLAAHTAAMGELNAAAQASLSAQGVDADRILAAAAEVAVIARLRRLRQPELVNSLKPHLQQPETTSAKRLRELLVRGTTAPLADLLREGEAGIAAVTAVLAEDERAQAQLEVAYAEVNAPLAAASAPIDKKALAGYLRQTYPDTWNQVLGVIQGADVADKVWEQLRPDYELPFADTDEPTG